MRKLIKLSIFLFLGIFLVLNMMFLPTNAAENHTITSVKASHILVETKSQADFIKSKIDGGESFETMAKKYSKCPSGENGGNLGYFEKGQMVPEFEDAAFELPVGKVSEPVKTEFGWHIIKVYDKK